MSVLKQLRGQVGREKHGVVRADNEIVVKFVEFNQVWQLINLLVGFLINGKVARGANLNGDVFANYLLQLFLTQVDAVTKAIGIEVDHRLGLRNLFLCLGTVERDL